jgi:hypothetical protein
MLDDQLLNAFIHSFYGYGSYSARTWFIGMEEGGGATEDEIVRRLSFWQSRGQKELEDVCAYHVALGIDRFFREPVKLQRTWAQLCRIALVAKGEPEDLAAIKAFQKDRLGRWNGSTCLMELLPLPSPGTNKWFYRDWSNLSLLSSREEYKDQVLPIRIQNLKNRIKKMQPTTVVFYGTVYWTYWESVAGSTFTRLDPYGFGWAKKNSTNFLIIQHPAAKGISNQYFQKAGELLKSFSPI